jgi:hypothetical protein
MCAASPGMQLGRIMTALAVLAMWSTPVSAWWDGGHMQIAAIAYTKLTPGPRQRSTPFSSSTLTIRLGLAVCKLT